MIITVRVIPVFKRCKSIFALIWLSWCFLLQCNKVDEVSYEIQPARRIQQWYNVWCQQFSKRTSLRSDPREWVWMSHSIGGHTYLQLIGLINYVTFWPAVPCFCAMSQYCVQYWLHSTILLLRHVKVTADVINWPQSCQPSLEVEQIQVESIYKSPQNVNLGEDHRVQPGANMFKRFKLFFRCDSIF